MIGALGRRASAVAAGAVLIGLASAAPAAADPPATPAAITLTPTCAPKLGKIHVDGVNFNPFNDVLVTFDAGTGGQPESFATETDGFGRFGIDITPQAARTAVTYQVRADDFRLREATATFTVPCAAPPPPPPPPTTFTPRLVIFPPLGPPGFVTTVTGTGFPPGEPVTLQWDRGILDVEGPKPLTSDGSGGFTRQILIFHHDVRGARVLSASPGPGAASSYVAPAAQFLVVPGTLQPGDFANRR